MKGQFPDYHPGYWPFLWEFEYLLASLCNLKVPPSHQPAKQTEILHKIQQCTLSTRQSGRNLAKNTTMCAHHPPIRQKSCKKYNNVRSAPANPAEILHKVQQCAAATQKPANTHPMGYSKSNIDWIKGEFGLLPTRTSTASPADSSNRE
ncbi:hypothetical protein [Paenibacillus borealis]|uniref:hypothetical protein n=1 Tax=Paenibacillus borealis TaxID=160799 RepID=UPI0012FDE9FA|nr:hypothetical protein [Paenibacillus borealis]